MPFEAVQYRTFVTVGTHEQPFDRLLNAVDALAAERAVPVPVFIQAGYSNYEPRNCDWERFVEPLAMGELMAGAEVVITHGGPSTFMEALEHGRAPIVAPRLTEYREHINDHQAEFARKVADRFGCIVVVENMADLPRAVSKARSLETGGIASNNARFCEQLSAYVQELFA